MSLYKIVKKIHFKLVNKFVGHRTLPWRYYKYLQVLLNLLFGGRKNTLSPKDESLTALYNNKNLNSELSKVIKLNCLNKWTLDSEVLNYIWQQLEISRPKVILEFGTGTSTKMLLEYFNKYPNFNYTLISIDQDSSFLYKTIKELNKIPTHVSFHPILSDLSEVGYDINYEIIESIINRFGRINMVIIDGPHGNWKIRKHTLPSILEFCEGKASWYLDDAFRDSEMEILKDWSKNQQIKVKGIVNIGKGLGVGIICN